MSVEKHARLTARLSRALSLDPRRRIRFLERLRRAEPQVCSELESLLRLENNLPSILEPGAPMRTATAAAGSEFGPYRIVEEIGEGGMGIVYRAEQQAPIQRQVALKLIRGGMETNQVFGRFEAERRTLERLEHPNIARILDAGATPEGRPYVAMEYVRGEPITAFAERNRLGLRERLHLFLQVCDGIRHAHQNAVIHRDIKPSNVLVTLAGGSPSAKIIDFGIAKATTLGADPGLTMEAQMLGTPAYMSPEQAGSSSAGVDVRTDIFSLGAVLHELLTGRPPIEPADLRGKNFDAIRSLVREQEPLPPSVRVKKRHRDPRESTGIGTLNAAGLARALRGDLDCIVMKALSRERERRYANVDALSADLRRYLGDQPVEAVPPTILYRIRKLLRRRRGPALVLATVFSMLVWTAVTVLIDVRRVARERDRAEEVSEFLAGLFEAPYFVSGRHPYASPKEILRRNAIKVESELADRPVLQARLKRAIGEAFWAVDESRRAIPLLEDADETLRTLLGADAPLAAAARSDLARAYADQERFVEAEALHLDALASRRRAVGDANLETLTEMGDLGFLYRRWGRDDKAARWLRQAVAGFRSLLGEDDVHTLVTTSLLASALLELRQLDEAQELLERALPRMPEDLDEKPMALYNLACIHALRGERGPALNDLRAAIQAGFGTGLYGDRNLAPLHHDPEFMALARQELVHRRGERWRLESRAAVFTEQGDYRAAEKIYEYLLESIRPSWGSDRLEYGIRLARVYLMDGKYRPAEPLLQAWLDFIHEASPPRRNELVTTLWDLAQVRIGLGEIEAARGMLRQTLPIAEGATGLGMASWSPYARAGLEALDGHAEAALSDLAAAVDLGFDRLDLLRHDLALASVRDRPEFHRLADLLVLRYEQPVPAPRPFEAAVSRDGSLPRNAEAARPPSASRPLSTSTGEPGGGDRRPDAAVPALEQHGS